MSGSNWYQNIPLSPKNIFDMHNMCQKWVDRDVESKTKPNNFLKKLFFEDIKMLYKIYSLQKKLFQKIIGFCFSTLDHDLSIFGTCCAYQKCSLDLAESFGTN